MTIAKRCSLQMYLRIGFLVILAGGFSQSFGQKTSEELPVVAAASVPLYPRTALLVHIQGTVKIRVTTNGTKVSSVEVENGPPMLARAAQENIRTWQFQRHNPTTFLVTFDYRIEEPAGCSVNNSTAVLRMPSDVQISAKGVHTCDPASKVASPSPSER